MTKIDPVELAKSLIRIPSVTPKDEGALTLLADELQKLGFQCELLRFSEPGADDIENLVARWGESEPVFCFAGHTDVVPPGAEEDWTSPPFEPTIRDGMLLGRGSADMKGSIAAFVCAAERAIAKKPAGSILLMITGDEEGPAINGTRKILRWMEEKGEKISHCLVGEPSSSETLGDMIKVGRRGSMNCWLTVFGSQGHVAYPHRAKNPIPGLLKKLLTLSETPLDEGYKDFQPSSLQITDIHVGNPASNVIPSKAAARFNVRFNPNWTAESLEKHIRMKLDEAAALSGLSYELSAVCSGDAFLTTDEKFLALVSTAISDKTGLIPDRSTSGGTSDARFIKAAAPVCEFGLVGSSIHKVDECTPVSDIQLLADIYEAILDRYFADSGALR